MHSIFYVMRRALAAAATVCLAGSAGAASIWQNATPLTLNATGTGSFAGAANNLSSYTVQSVFSGNAYTPDLSLPGVERIYRFDLPAARYLEITPQINPANTAEYPGYRVLLLLDSNRASAYGTYEGYQSGRPLVQAGRHYIVVERTVTSVTAFSFFLGAYRNPYGTDEHFNGPAATPLTCGQSLTSTLVGQANHIAAYGSSSGLYTTPNSDLDRQFRFTLTSTSYVQITDLLQRDYQIALLSDTFSSNTVELGSIIQSRQLTPGTYYISVEQSGGQLSGNFQLQLLCSPSAFPGYSTVSGPVVAEGTPVTGTFASGTSQAKYFQGSHGSGSPFFIPTPLPDRTVQIASPGAGTLVVRSKAAVAKHSLSVINSSGRTDDALVLLTKQEALGVSVAAGTYYINIEQGSATATDVYNYEFRRYAAPAGVSVPANTYSYLAVQGSNAISSNQAYSYSQYQDYNYPTNGVALIKPDSTLQLYFDHQMFSNGQYVAFNLQDTLLADINFDGDFVDAGEVLYASSTATASRTVTITAPSALAAAAGKIIVFRGIAHESGTRSGVVTDFLVRIAGPATPYVSPFRNAQTISCANAASPLISIDWAQATQKLTNYQFKSAIPPYRAGANYPGPEVVYKLVLDSPRELYTGGSSDYRILILSDSTTASGRGDGTTSFINPDLNLPGQVLSAGTHYLVAEWTGVGTPSGGQLLFGCNPAFGPYLTFTRASATAVSLGTAVTGNLQGASNRLPYYNGYIPNVPAPGLDRLYAFTLADSAYVTISFKEEKGFQFELLNDTTNSMLIAGGGIIANSISVIEDYNVGRGADYLARQARYFNKKYPPGTYYLAIEQNEAKATDSYTFIIEASAAPKPAQPAAITATASLPIGGSVSGTLLGRASALNFVRETGGNYIFPATSTIGPDVDYRLNLSGPGTKVLRRSSTARHSVLLFDSTGRNLKSTHQINTPIVALNATTSQGGLSVSAGNYFLHIEQGSATVNDAYTFDYQNYLPTTNTAPPANNTAPPANNTRLVTVNGTARPYTAAYAFDQYRIEGGGNPYYPILPAPFITLVPDSVTVLGFGGTLGSFQDSLYADLNFDGDFKDAGELLYGSASAAVNHNANLVLPNGNAALAAAKGKGVILRLISRLPGTNQGFTLDMPALIKGTAAVSNPPAITSFSPLGGPVGERVRIRGRYLSGTTAAYFGSVQAIQIGVSGDSLVTAIVPAGASGSNRIQLLVGGTVVQSGPYFVVSASAPIITGFSPGQGKPGDTVRIVGRFLGFTQNVVFGPVGATYKRVVNDSLIKTVVPVGAATSRILLSGSFGSVYSANIFSVTPPPAITSVSPLAGSVGDRIRIRGRNLAGASAVYFGTTAVTQFGVSGDTLVTAIVPVGTSGSVRIQVVTPAGTGQSGPYFIVQAVRIPTITRFTPAVGRYGDTILIQGIRFAAVTGGYFSGARIAYIRVLNDSNLRAVVPTGASTGKVILIIPQGNVMSTLDFTVLQPPAITSFAPTVGSPGDKIRIRGRGLSAATAIVFGSATATTLFHSGDTLVTVLVPANVTQSAYRLVAQSPNGSGTSQAYFQSFTVPYPTVASITPSSGRVGDAVVIKGNHLATTRYTRFGSTGTLSQNTIVGDTIVQTRVPVGAVTGQIDVSTQYAFIHTPQVFTVLTNARMGLDETTVAAEGALLAYPNPARGETTLRLPDADEEATYDLALYAPDGRRLQAVRPTGAALGQGMALKLPIVPGIYLVQVTGGGSRKLLRVVVE